MHTFGAMSLGLMVFRAARAYTGTVQVSAGDPARRALQCVSMSDVSVLPMASIQYTL